MARLLALAAAVLLAAGCGEEEGRPVSTSCIAEPATIVRALQVAPQTVTLEDGETISGCLRGATTSADLQNVGIALSRAAEDLESLAFEGDERAALQLGYLVGAARKGSARTTLITGELVHRLERSAALDDEVPPAVVAAVQRGMAAGAARG